MHHGVVYPEWTSYMIPFVVDLLVSTHFAPSASALQETRYYSKHDVSKVSPFAFQYANSELYVRTMKLLLLLLPSNHA